MVKFRLWFSERSRSLYAIAVPSVVCLSSSCLSVTLERPTQPVKIFGNFPSPFGTLATGIHGKFYGDRPSRTPPSRGLNARGVAKYVAIFSKGKRITLRLLYDIAIPSVVCLSVVYLSSV